MSLLVDSFMMRAYPVPRRDRTLLAAAVALGCVLLLVSPPCRAETVGPLPISFVEHPQAEPSGVLYVATSVDRVAGFAPDGVWISMAGSLAPADHDGVDATGSQDVENVSRWAVKIEFEGARRVTPRGIERREGIVSYFRGSRDEWNVGLATYAKVIYEDLWPGIDLVYYGSGGNLKYDLIVAPHADPGDIRFVYRGVADVGVDVTGALEVVTPVETIEDAPPYSYQESETGRIEVDVAYRVDDDCADGPAVEFEVASYDRSRPLVIDPTMFVFSGYIGGSDTDTALDVAVDAEGFIYVTGYTTSSPFEGFPVVAGPFLAGGDFAGDAYVAKLTPDGASLVYCGYVGGASTDVGRGIATDSLGRAYVVGSTWSDQNSFPVRVGPGLGHNGGQDAFICRVNVRGTALDYCGYVGGNDYDGGRSVAVDFEGSAYLVGRTDSTESTFPVRVGPRLSFGGIHDGFITKIGPSGASVLYCGYIGGTRSDEAMGVAVDMDGHAYVGGRTHSNQASFPVIVGPDLTYNGADDAFVAKVLPDGTDFVYCGYVGGDNHDQADDLAIDADGGVYLTGYTASNETSLPVSGGPDLTYNGSIDAFLARVEPGGTDLSYCGYIGGDGQDFATGIAVDAARNAWVCGYTQSRQMSLPVRTGPDLTFNGGVQDAFVARVTPGGEVLDLCGYVGGSEEDWGHAVAVCPDGGAIVVGNTDSNESSFPVVGGPDASFNGGRDAFVLHLRAPLGCEAGRVDVSGLEPNAIVLRVNGRAGTQWQPVRVALNGAVSITIEASPSGPSPGVFALYAWLELPTAATVQPHPRRLGLMCFPTFFSGGAPAPDVVWNNAGHPNELGTPDYPSTPAPSIVADVPNGVPAAVTFTLQGFLADNGSVARDPASITNSVSVIIQ